MDTLQGKWKNGGRMKDKHNKLEEKWGVNKHTKMTLNL